MPISAATVNDVKSHFGMPLSKKYTVVSDAPVTPLDLLNVLGPSDAKLGECAVDASDVVVSSLGTDCSEPDITANGGGLGTSLVEVGGSPEGRPELGSHNA